MEKIESEAVNLSVFINFDDFKASLNWFQIIHKGEPGNFCYLGGPSRWGLLDSLKICGSAVCNVSVSCIHASKIEKFINFGLNFGEMTFIPPF